MMRCIRGIPGSGAASKPVPAVGAAGSTVSSGTTVSSDTTVSPGHDCFYGVVRRNRVLANHWQFRVVAHWRIGLFGNGGGVARDNDRAVRGSYPDRDRGEPRGLLVDADKDRADERVSGSNAEL